MFLQIPFSDCDYIRFGHSFGNVRCFYRRIFIHCSRIVIDRFRDAICFCTPVPVSCLSDTVRVF